jgi:hypothetical protein
LPRVLRQSQNNKAHQAAVRKHYEWVEYTRTVEEFDCNDESGSVGGYYDLPYVHLSGYVLPVWVNVATTSND